MMNVSGIGWGVLLSSSFLLGVAVQPAQSFLRAAVNVQVQGPPIVRSFHRGGGGRMSSIENVVPRSSESSFRSFGMMPVSATALRARKASSTRGNKSGDPYDKGEDEEEDATSQQQQQRQAALDGVLHQIERTYGRGSVVKMGGGGGGGDIECIPSGALTLDLALGGGGYPKGRVVEIYGPESSGKTTLALHAIASVQRRGGGGKSSSSPSGTAAFIDAEHALDPVYAQNLGVDLDRLYVCQPDSGEMALDVVDQLVRSSAVDVIVVDSVAALVPRAELEGDMSDIQIGLQARLMSKALRKITGSLALSRSTIIFLNQLRSKVGVVYGNPEVTSGGNALKFYASQRLDIRRKEILPDNRGIRVKVKVVKNKIAPPFAQVELDILFGTGIDGVACAVDAALDVGVLQRRGSWYAVGPEYRTRVVARQATAPSIDGEVDSASNKNKNSSDDAANAMLAQGRNNVIELLKQNPHLAEQIEGCVREALTGGANHNGNDSKVIVSGSAAGGEEEEEEEEEEDTNHRGGGGKKKAAVPQKPSAAVAVAGFDEQGDGGGGGDADGDLYMQ